ncbi:MAG: MFS transporter [Ignavibacteria bacterium]|nr:MFS transporter [Ignavibacteria bacterium]
MKSYKSTHIVIFLTIFIDLLGFGIIIPLLPFFMDDVMHLNESTIGIIVALFSLMQFIFTPVWGSLSDIYGRKPILIMSLAGNVISYFLMALVFSGFILSFWLLIISRILAGIFSANLSAAQSVISDITTKENRSRGMGYIGAAFSLGFVFGPALGGVLSEHFGFGIPIFLASFFSLSALILCITALEETLPVELREQSKKDFKGVTIINLKSVHEVLTNRKEGFFIILFFFITFSFANIHATFVLFTKRPAGFHLTQEQSGLILSFLGIIGALVQFFLIKFFKEKLGEEKSLILGNFITTLGLIFIPVFNSIFLLLIVIFILAFGNGLNIPMALGLISKNTEKDRQGSVLGINQALGSLARVLGPIWGTFLYEKFGYQYPFISGGVFMFLVTLFSFKILLKK